jgi:hypothetical protein
MVGGYYTIFLASVRDNPHAVLNVDGLSLSHPHFVQLYGFTTSSTMYAAVFHDGMSFHLQISELDSLI